MTKTKKPKKGQIQHNLAWGEIGIVIVWDRNTGEFKLQMHGPRTEYRTIEALLEACKLELRRNADEEGYCRSEKYKEESIAKEIPRSGLN